MASNLQIQANKHNSLKSTGPKTKLGKVKISQNALKHGILSSAIINESKNLGENTKEFVLLRQRLADDLQPEGILEEMLVDKVAICYWRLLRAVRAENGLIRLQTDNLDFKEFIKVADEAKKQMRFKLLTRFDDRLKNSISAQWTIDELEQIKKNLQELGYMSDEDIKEYTYIKNPTDDKDSFALIYFFNATAKGEVEGEPDRTKGIKALTSMLEKDIEQLSSSKDAYEELEKDHIEAKTLAFSIPLNDSADKLTRYETATENQLYRAMNQLIKLQTLRKGGRVVSARVENVEMIEQ